MRELKRETEIDTAYIVDKQARHGTKSYEIADMVMTPMLHDVAETTIQRTMACCMTMQPRIPIFSRFPCPYINACWRSTRGSEDAFAARMRCALQSMLSGHPFTICGGMGALVSISAHTWCARTCVEHDRNQGLHTPAGARSSRSRASHLKSGTPAARPRLPHWTSRSWSARRRACSDCAW